MPLSPQAAEILGKSARVILTERVDDVAFLIGQMVTMGLPEVLDRHLPRHWTQRGRRWGWTVVMWLAYMVTEGDHRQVSVATSLTGMQHTLSRLTAQVIEPLDVRDDRVSPLLQHVSKPAYWHARARDLHERSMEMYDVSQDVIRGDATTVSGDHEVTEGGLGQLGQRTDDPTRPQSKVMMGSLDPLGMSRAHDCVFRRAEVEKDRLTGLRKVRFTRVAAKDAALAALSEIRGDSAHVALPHSAIMSALGIGARLAPIFGCSHRSILR